MKIDPKKTKELKKIKLPSPLLGCRFDPSGKYVFAGAQDNSIRRWDWSTTKATAFTGHKSWIRALAFDNSGKTLFSGDYRGRLLVWDVEGDGKKPVKDIDAHRGFLRALAVNPTGKLLASCGNDHQIRIWSIPDCKMTTELTGHECHVYNVAFHPDGKHLVSADLKGKVKQWDLATGNVVREFDGSILHKYDKNFRADIGGVRSMDFSADGSLLLCAGITNVSNAFAGVGNPLFVGFDWKTGKPAKNFKPAKAFRGSGWGVVTHPSKLILGVGAGGGGGALWFWKPESDKSIHMLKLPTNARDLDLHVDNRHIAIAFADGYARVYGLLES